MLATRMLSVSIDVAPEQVIAYIRDPRNLPQWAPAFCKSVRAEGDGWIVDTARGPVGLRFVAPNPFGVVDHYVSTAPGVEIYVPLRVLANQSGSEVVFTLFRLPDMSDEQFDEDAGLVLRDLNTLKTMLER